MDGHMWLNYSSPHPQCSYKRFLRNAHTPKFPHPRIALVLLFQQLILARYVPTIAFWGHILAHGGGRLAADDFAAGAA